MKISILRKKEAKSKGREYWGRFYFRIHGQERLFDKAAIEQRLQGSQAGVWGLGVPGGRAAIQH